MQAALAVAAVCGLVVVALAGRTADEHDASRSRALAQPVATSVVATLASSPTTPSRAAASGDLYVLTDSVLLGAEDALAKRLPAWHITVDGVRGLTLKAAKTHVTQQATIPPLVVVGLGYNSYWEQHRRHYDSWAAQFDSDAEALLSTLEAEGARTVVWVTLRELSRAYLPRAWARQLPRYGFYYPYVNEQLRALAGRHPEVLLAGWDQLANRAGITYDAVHLNPTGAALMTDLIVRTAGIG